MTEDSKRIGILQASPRKKNSERIAQLIAGRVESAGLEAEIFTLRDVHIEPCIACDVCQETGDCFMTDGMDPFVRFLYSVDALVIVTPIYFAGPPAQLKAAYDRLQFLWSRRYILEMHPIRERKPLLLVLLGTGQDPFGYQPVITITHSALRMADFELDETLPLIGYAQGSAEEDAAFETQLNARVNHLVSAFIEDAPTEEEDEGTDGGVDG